jgi:uncharacterized membrane protein
VFLPFVAIALLQAAPADPEPYRALGASPLWQASIYGGFMTFETPGRDRLTVETPARQETGLGFAHSSPELSISVEHGDCTDGITRRIYADRVTVRVGEARFEGCGGASRGVRLPAPYAAAGGEPFWSLEIADGRLYFGVNDDVWIVRTPTRAMTRDGRIRHYTAPGISVLLRRENCELEDERVYADAVTVRAGTWTVEGCGGRVVREAPAD